MQTPQSFGHDSNSRDISSLNFSRASLVPAVGNYRSNPCGQVEITNEDPRIQLIASVKIPITSWTIRKGYIHGADMLPAIEYLVGKLAGVSAELVSIERIEFMQPALSQLTLSVSMQGSSTATADDPLLVAMRATIISKDPDSESGTRAWQVVGSLNGNPNNHCDSRNPLIKSMFSTRGACRTPFINSEGGVTFALTPLPYDMIPNLARMYGVASATVLDLISQGLLALRGRILPMTTGILIKNAQILTGFDIPSSLYRTRSLDMHAVQARTSGSRTFDNYSVISVMRDAQGEPLLKINSEVSIARSSDALDLFLERTRHRVSEVLSINAASRHSSSALRKEA